MSTASHQEETLTRILVALIAALTLILGACSSTGGEQVASLVDGSGDAADGTSNDSPAVGTTDEEALLAFAACMRENGVEGFEDPVVDADGSVQFDFRPGRDAAGEDPFGGVDRDTVRQAMQTCSENLDGVALGPGGGGFDTEEFQDTFVEFAACMRDNGVQMDDPDFSSFGPGQGGGEPGERGGPFADIDFSDPDVQSALEVCQPIFGDDLPFGGPGVGRPPGSGDVQPPEGGLDVPPDVGSSDA